MLLTSNLVIKHYGVPDGRTAMVLTPLTDFPTITKLPLNVFCSKLLVQPLKRALKNIVERGLEKELVTWNGCFNIRASKGNDKVYSLHAHGLAIDINALTNAYGKKPTISVELVKCFTDAGFDWGGKWKTPDGMHFQLSLTEYNKQRVK